jgi:hypothetical protein
MANYNENLSEGTAVLATIPPQSSAAVLLSQAFTLQSCRRALAIVHTGVVAGTVNAQFVASATIAGTYLPVAGTAVVAIAAGAEAIAETEIKAETLSNLNVGPYLKLQVANAGGSNLIEAVVLGGVARYSPTSDFNLTLVAPAVVA